MISTSIVNPELSIISIRLKCKNSDKKLVGLNSSVLPCVSILSKSRGGITKNQNRVSVQSLCTGGIIYDLSGTCDLSEGGNVISTSPPLRQISDKSRGIT